MIVNGKGESFRSSRMERHEIESHSAEVSPKLAAFFRTLPLQIASLAPDTKALLEKWKALPDLLFIAREQANVRDFSALMKKLETQFRVDQQAFKVTTVYRGIESCATAEHQDTMATQLIVNEHGESIEVRGLIQHDFEVHTLPIPPDLATFLRALP